MGQRRKNDADEYLAECGCRRGWETAVLMSDNRRFKLCAWITAAGIVLVQEFQERQSGKEPWIGSGWDAFLPATGSARGDDTIEALRAFLGTVPTVQRDTQRPHGHASEEAQEDFDRRR